MEYEDCKGCNFLIGIAKGTVPLSQKFYICRDRHLPLQDIEKCEKNNG